MITTLIYSIMLNFGVLPLVKINHVMQKCLSSAGAYQHIVPVLAIFAQNLVLYNKNNRVLLSRALCVIGSLGNLMFKLHISLCCNLVPRSRGWAKPKARSGQVRKFDFFDWLFQNMAVTALKFERALRGFSGPLGNSMSVFMQIRHCARNHNNFICILGTFRCLQSA